ncbi:MAG TPA: hypothetical protein VME45_22695 [Stellaceae bacterium]|nr:hypothetical protein [Stellaceae bacterium]
MRQQNREPLHRQLALLIIQGRSTAGWLLIACYFSLLAWTGGMGSVSARGWFNERFSPAGRAPQ